MALTASHGFGPTWRDIWQNDSAIDMIADQIKGALFTNAITTPNADTNTAYGAAPFNGSEVTNSAGTAYVAGGAILANDTITVASPAAGQIKYDADDLSWSSATFSGARGVLLYDDTITTPVADPALVVVTFGADFAVTGGTFTIQWNASGIFYLDYTP